MRVWRIARRIYPPLDGEGARRAGGRWNRPGTPVVYTAAHLSLALLEGLVHVDLEDLPDDLVAFEIELPEDLLIEVVAEEDLPEGWNRTIDHMACQQIGEEWLHSESSAVLQVPSVVVPQESNYLINPAHPEAGRVQVVAWSPFQFDVRLPGIRERASRA